MGQLRMTISGVSATRTIADEKMTAVANIIYDNLVLPNWREGVPLPATQQEKLQAVLERVAIELAGMARNCRRRELRAVNEAAEQAEAAGIGL